MAKIIHLTRDDIKNIDNPINNLVPDFIGQYCITTDGKVYYAKGLTSQDWILATVDVSNLSTKEQLNLLNINMNKEIDELTRRIDILESLIKEDEPDINIPIMCPTMVSGTAYTLVSYDEEIKHFDSGVDRAKTITMTIPNLPNTVKQVKGAIFTFDLSTDDGYGELYSNTRVVRNGVSVYTVHNWEVGAYGVTDGSFSYNIDFPLQKGDQVICTIGTRQTLAGSEPTGGPTRGTYMYVYNFAVKYDTIEAEQVEEGSMIAGLSKTLVSDTTVMDVVATSSGIAETKEIVIPNLPSEFNSASLVINAQSYDAFGGTENPININASVYRNGNIVDQITFSNFFFPKTGSTAIYTINNLQKGDIIKCTFNCVNNVRASVGEAMVRINEVHVKYDLKQNGSMV